MNSPAIYLMFSGLRILSFMAAMAIGPFRLSAEDNIVEQRPHEIREVVAIDHVCAWPNLTLMKDGRLVATIFNQPSHGSQSGDVDCWESHDGITWTFLGTPAPHEPNTNRMNVAAGLAGNGDLIVLSSGWSNEQQPGQPKKAKFRDAVLDVWVCRSADGGKTWTQTATFPPAPEGFHPLIPFGDIVIARDGSLRTTAYTTISKPGERRKRAVWIVRSDDDGRTWEVQAKIGEGANETSLFRWDDQTWLAAARTEQSVMALYRSVDDGRNWTQQGQISEPGEINGHLSRLNDGRLLLTYGNRAAGKYGVLAKSSSDSGVTWSAPVRLVDTLNGDCGYPSSVPLSGGNIVTVWYSKSSTNHNRYHMGSAVWKFAVDE